jgi:hypothetical protein
MGALRTGVPVAARDTGYVDGVFPRDDPGAWHGPADMFAGAAWFYTATLVVLIRLRILSRRRDRNGDDGNVTAAPSAGHQNLRAQDVRPRASCSLGMPDRRSVAGRRPRYQLGELLCVTYSDAAHCSLTCGRTLSCREPSGLRGHR